MSTTSSPINVSGAMVELVDTPVLGTGRAIGEGSSPFRPTIVDTIDTMSDTISYGLIRSRKKGVLVVQGSRAYVSLRNR